MDSQGFYAGGVSVSFPEAAVIFEDGYANRPGEFVPRQSTRTTLSCVAHGGPNGGTAAFSISGDDKLVRVMGRSLPVTVTVPPEQRVAFEIVYEGKEPSGNENDIKVHGEFEENNAEEGSGPLVSDAELTAVKVELETKFPAYENNCKQRHIYGVGETVFQHCYPEVESGRWTVSIDGRAATRLQNGQTGFSASATAGIGAATFSMSQVSYTIGFRVLEPYVEVRNARANQSDVSPVIGEAGHLLLFLDQYVGPYYVSFREIYMMEIPDESNNCPHSGYFSDSSTGWWSHTSQAGAGDWNPVGENGYWGTDKAGYRSSYGSPWSEGEKVWDIPIGWGFGGRTVAGSITPLPTKQKFEIHANGTFKITKHDHSAERNVLGMIWVDGSLVAWPW